MFISTLRRDVLQDADNVIPPWATVAIALIIFGESGNSFRFVTPGDLRFRFASDFYDNCWCDMPSIWMFGFLAIDSKYARVECNTT